jgi:uncharacterized membrane protein YphA (DoxX/SURF4 family)
MNPQPSNKNQCVIDVLGVLGRWSLGLLFIYLGLSKALHPVEFLKLVRQYDLLQSPWLLDSVAAMLPWFEVFCGGLLLAGIAVRGSALTIVVMLVPFTGAIFRRALALQSALAIPFCMVKFDCGCGTGEVFVCRKLLENLILILLAGWLLRGRGRALSVRYRLR